jgi:hypothetical protein
MRPTHHFGNGNPLKRMMHNNKIYERLVVCCQSLHAYFCCRKSMARTFGLDLESPSCVSKSQINGSTCHLFIGG